MATDAHPGDEPDRDTVYLIPDWVAERMALCVEAWAKAGRMFPIDGELLDRLTAQAKRRAGPERARSC